MSDELQQAREQIRKADEQMAQCFLRRMQAAKQIAAYKQAHGLPVLDPAQQARVLERGAALIDDAELKSYYVQFLEQTMALSRSYQMHLMEGMRVAYSGVEGAFAYIAAKRIFPQATLCAYPSFTAAYEAAASGECDAAVIPIENSSAGEVGDVTDLMFSGSLFVNGVYTLPIVQNLLGVQGASVDSVQKVVSHPQALHQCADYLRAHGYETLSAENTAVAAKQVAQQNDVTLAAVASAETAKLYGLRVLDHDINENKTNTTKFAVFSRAENEASAKNDRFILMFTVNDVTGSLAKAINVISACGFNMQALRSRPVREKAWQYYFYVEGQGNLSSGEGGQMLSLLSRQCETLKVVGQFTAETELREETV